MTDRRKRHAYPGRLIAVEGLDGSGKSTQIYLVKRWLELQNLKVFFTEWNSSTVVKKATRRGKTQQLLTPTTFSLIHCTDSASTTCTSGWSGSSGLWPWTRRRPARSSRSRSGPSSSCPRSRPGSWFWPTATSTPSSPATSCGGGDRAWLESLYGIAIVPDIVFYLRVSPRQLVERNFQLPHEWGEGGGRG